SDILIALLPGIMLATAYSGDMHEFLTPRPFDRRQRFVGSVLPALVLALLLPAISPCFFSLDWFNHDGLIGLFTHRTLDVRVVGYMRRVLGATFLPEAWPAAGLAPELWTRLHPLLYLDVLRTALVSLAMVFGVPFWKAREKPNRQARQVIALSPFVAGFG